MPLNYIDIEWVYGYDAACNMGFEKFGSQNKALNSKFLGREILASYFVGSIVEIGLDIYSISNSNLFYSQNTFLCEKILKECEDVQDSVWNKRFSTFENTFEVGNLVLLVVENKVKGFLSASVHYGTNEHIFIYYSDAMLDISLQGKSLSTLGFAILHNSILDVGIGRKSYDNIFSVMVSGNFAAFGLFLKKEFFAEFDFNNLDLANLNILKDILSTSFANLSITQDGIILAAWGKQHKISRDFWPPSFYKTNNIPKNVNYYSGDALLKLFKLDADMKSNIDKYINKRMQNVQI